MFDRLIANYGFFAIDIVRLMRRCIDHDLNLKGIGLNPAEARALCFAAAFPDSRQNQLAERMGIEPVTFVGHIDRLEARGLIVRDTDPSDRRSKIVRLTETAYAVVDTYARTTAAIRAEATAGFTKKEAAQLVNLMHRLRDRFQEMEAARSSEGARDEAAAGGPEDGEGRDKKRKRRIKVM